MQYQRYLAIASVACAALLSACTSMSPTLEKPTDVKVPGSQVIRHQEKVSFSEVPGWNKDNLKEAWPAFMRSCQVNASQPEWETVCAKAVFVDGSDNNAIREYFESAFDPYRITTDASSDTGLATGYYEPVMKGSYKKQGIYQTAMYAEPKDLLDIDFISQYPQLKGVRLRGKLVQNAKSLKQDCPSDLLAMDLLSAYPKLDGLTMWGRLEGRKVVPYGKPVPASCTMAGVQRKVVPYETRGEIEASGKLRGQEIVFVDDVIDGFFLEIQGAGRINLPDGKVIRLAYANQNGRPYRSIGRYLLDKGELKPGQASAQQIKKWVRNHPDRLREVLDANPSYVFFREEKLKDPNVGPKGSQGVPLIPGRSIAVDRKYILMGTPVFLDTTMPNTTTPLRRLVMAQDTGGAIAGPVRADFFWGWGKEAGAQAGKMKQKLRVWLLLPKQ